MIDCTVAAGFNFALGKYLFALSAFGAMLVLFALVFLGLWVNYKIRGGK